MGLDLPHFGVYCLYVDGCFRNLKLEDPSSNTLLQSLKTGCNTDIVVLNNSRSMVFVRAGMSPRW